MFLILEKILKKVVFKKYIESVYIFGSITKKYLRSSDIDVCLKFYKNLTDKEKTYFLLISKINEQIEESKIISKIDISNYQDLTTEFIQHIKQYWIEVKLNNNN